MLSKSDLTEVKTYKCPPAGVKMTMEAVCIVLGVEPVKASLESGRIPGVDGEVDDYWVRSTSRQPPSQPRLAFTQPSAHALGRGPA